MLIPVPFCPEVAVQLTLLIAFTTFSTVATLLLIPATAFFASATSFSAFALSSSEALFGKFANFSSASFTFSSAALISASGVPSALPVPFGSTVIFPLSILKVTSAIVPSSRTVTLALVPSPSTKFTVS